MTRREVEQLALRMGFEDSCFRDSEDDMIRTLLGSGHPFLEGITLERLEREHFVRLNVAPNHEPTPSSFGTQLCPSAQSALELQARQ